MDFSCWILIIAGLCVAGCLIYVGIKEMKKHKRLKALDEFSGAYNDMTKEQKTIFDETQNRKDR